MLEPERSSNDPFAGIVMLDDSNLVLKHKSRKEWFLYFQRIKINSIWNPLESYFSKSSQIEHNLNSKLK